MDTDIKLAIEVKSTFPKHYCGILQRKYKALWQKVEEFCEQIKSAHPLSNPQKAFHWINQSKQIPICPVKGVQLKFRSDKFDYRKFSERGIADDKTIEKRATNRVSYATGKQRLGSVKFEDFVYEKDYDQIALKQVKQMFEQTNNVGGVCSTIKTAQNAQLYCFIMNQCSYAETLSEALYCFVHGLNGRPLCPITNLQLPFINFVGGYKSTHPNASVSLKAQTKSSNIDTSKILPLHETVVCLTELLNELKQANKNINNLKQSAYKRNPDLIISVEEHTKLIATLTKKWSEKAYLLLHQPGLDDASVRFTSFKEGYREQFINVNCSAGENEMAEWIESLGYSTKRHQRILNNMEIDILIEDIGIGLEYHGEYFHNYELRGILYHKQKADLSLQQNLNLIQIFESEWYNKKDIVQSIIKSKLGLTKDRVYARSCSLRQLDVKTKDSFLQKNHIQGSDKSKWSYGLFFDDELVCCMTFGRGYNKKEDKVELVRFCNKLDATVVGGASKLLKHFIKLHKPMAMHTYADRRFANASNFYEQLGFVKTGQTVPNYFYFKSSMPQYMKLHHRYNFAKHLLPRKLKNFDLSKTEYENMKQNGYLKIYDAGSYTYELAC